MITILATGILMGGLATLVGLKALEQVLTIRYNAKLQTDCDDATVEIKRLRAWMAANVGTH